MSRERIQEHFSDLYEGSMDPGLAQQLKARIDADPELQADFLAFADTMRGLDFLKDEAIETPSNLSAMIAQRLETNEKRPVLTLAGFWRNFAFGAMACVAIGGAFMMIKNRTAGATTGADLTGGAPRIEAPRRLLDTIEIKVRANGPVLTYDSSGPKTITVLNAEDQKLLKKFALDGKMLNCPLENKGETPSVLQVEATGEQAKHYVILPGTGADYEAAGQGDLIAFAKVLSVKYRTVVHVQVPKDAESNLKWDISQTTAQEAAKTVLSSSEYTVTGDDKILIVQKQSL